VAIKTKRVFTLKIKGKVETQVQQVIFYIFLVCGFSNTWCFKMSVWNDFLAWAADPSIDWFAWFALAVSGLVFLLIHALAKKGVNFGLLVIIGLAVGVGAGLVFCGHTDFIAPIGNIYIRVLTAAVAPLIVVSVITGVTALGDTKKLTTLGVRSVFWLMINTAIAIALTLGTALFLGIGKNTGIVIDGVDTENIVSRNVKIVDVLTGFFPENLVNELGSNQIIPIIIASIAVGVVIILLGKEKTHAVVNLLDSLKEIIYKIVEFIVDATPYAVFALTAAAVSKLANRWEDIQSLLFVLAVSYALCIVHTYIVNGALLLFFARVNPFRFFKKIAQAQITAFTTQSSVCTLPVNVSSLIKKVGVSGEVANFTASLGTSLGMPACSGIWPILLAVFAINALGIPYAPQQYLVLCLLALAVSFGTAGVPGTATITATAVFVASGLPIEIIVILMPISAIADMARTATNVTAAAVSATIVAREQKALDLTIFKAKKSKLPEAEAAQEA
jgi:Na+/H+-dicarboxylate symporter